MARIPPPVRLFLWKKGGSPLGRVPVVSIIRIGCIWWKLVILLEANVCCLFSETSSADHESVLADDSSSSSTNAAASHALSADFWFFFYFPKHLDVPYFGVFFDCKTTTG